MLTIVRKGYNDCNDCKDVNDTTNDTTNNRDYCKSVFFKEKTCFEKMKKVKSKREIIKEYNLPTFSYCKDTQLTWLNDIYIYGVYDLSINKFISIHCIPEQERNTLLVLNKATEATEATDLSLNNILLYKKYMLREIKRKIQSYKTQDIIKNRHDPNKLISLFDVIELLVLSNLNCHYCKEDVFVFYELVRENKQWTLDRLDNSIGHYQNNCVICCLQCNIHRRIRTENA
jgi:hypothetical protein